MKNSSLIFGLLILVFGGLISCDKNDDISTPDPITTEADLTATLNDILEDSEAPGFTLSIVKDDAIIYQGAFGDADIAAEKAYTIQTTQPIGSISKTFVAAAIVKAIEQGHLTLETPINDILPFAVNNPKQAGSEILVKHLVTHTSGLVDEGETYTNSYHILPGEDLNSEGAQFLQGAFGVAQRETLPLGEYLAHYYTPQGDLYSLDNFANTAPGTQWAYSNIASSLAAYVVEVATGTPFRIYVKENILQPLQMNSTGYDVADLDPGKMAKLYWEKDLPLVNYFNDSYPDGSVTTNNEDLTKYLMDMMKGVKGQSSTLFAPEYYDLLFEALLAEGSIHPAVGDNQAVFWVHTGGDIEHTGSDPGTTTYLQFNETGNIGFLFLTNMDETTDEHEEAWAELINKVFQAIVAYSQAN